MKYYVYRYFFFLLIKVLIFRDVSGVETAISIHQGVKAEIDARSGLYEECITLAKKLINDGHYASEDIKSKLATLTDKRNLMVDRWQERWDWLNLCKYFEKSMYLRQILSMDFVNAYFSCSRSLRKFRLGKLPNYLKNKTSVLRKLCRRWAS